MTGDSIHARMRAELSSRDLFEQAVQQVFRYMETVDDRPVYPARDAVQSLEQFDEPLPPQPQAGADVLAALEGTVAPLKERLGAAGEFAVGLRLAAGMAAMRVPCTRSRPLGRSTSIRTCCAATSPAARQVCR